MHAGVCVDTVAMKSEEFTWNLCIHLDKTVSLFQDDSFCFIEKVILQLSTQIWVHCDGHIG